MRLGPAVLLSVAAKLAHAGGPGLQDPANPIKPEPPPAPSAPDPISERAGEHGLESTDRHNGLNFTAAIGGGVTVGIGIESAVGRGPSGSFRLASVAAPRLAFVAELTTVTMLRQSKGINGMLGGTRTDQANNLLFGIQLYANRLLWVRTGVGVGGFVIDQGKGVDPKVLAGPAGVVGGGFDLWRRRRVAIGVEIMTVGMLNRDGLLTTTGFMLDLSIE